jgi:two-component system sensor histidine kinase PilS (NtrC family)
VPARHSPPTDPKLQALLDFRRVLRWVYVARLSLAASIFAAAVFVWNRAASADTLVASLALAVTMVATAASVALSHVARRPLGRTFFTAQSLIDLLLVTAVVHVTGSGGSQFAALYILVIATAALLLPTGGGLLVAAAGCVFYFADVFLVRGAAPDLPLFLQLGVFGVVAGGSAFVSARLREAGAGSAELHAELVKFRLQAADILRNIRSGILTVDADGTLLYANPAAGALLGLELEERAGRPVLAEIARVAPELALALERAARHGERITRGEATITAGGRTFPIGLATTSTAAGAAGADVEGAPADGATAIFQDISDHKRLESLHLRAERLEAVAELSASLAHEIKNPLASIRSAVEQLGRMPGLAGADADGDAATLARLVVRESDRLSGLLSEFLDFARVRVTRLDAVDIGAVARDAAGLAAAHPDRREGVAVTCATPDEPLIVEGDHDLLHRAVFNLTLNAVQAAPAGGRVTVEVVPLAVDETPSGLSFDRGAIALRVTDDGPGIPEEIRDSLFEPFISARPGGSGLGLPIVHRAIEAHNGVVLVDGDHAGTRFTVLLPRQQDDRNV